MFGHLSLNMNIWVKDLEWKNQQNCFNGLLNNLITLELCHFSSPFMWLFS